MASVVEEKLEKGKTEFDQTRGDGQHKLGLEVTQNAHMCKDDV